MILRINGITQPDTLQKIAEDYFNYQDVHKSMVGNALNTFECFDRFNNLVLHKTQFTGEIYEHICNAVDTISNLF